MIRTYLFLFFLLVSFNSVWGQTIAYHPNKHWHVKGIFNVKSKAGNFNNFFPQYGWAQRLEKGTWQGTEWEDWKTRNKFSYPYLLEGHSWQWIIEQNKEIFKSNPNYLAEVDGKRLGYGATSKLCVSNKTLQKLFIADRLKTFKQLNDHEGSVSVEPSDGLGYCECINCKKIGSISNQVFFLANLTAKAIKSKYPHGKVNLYAYYQHAELPDITIEDNVHVTVIPDGFQSFYDGDVMLSVWAKKAKLKTYYEYFAIPQWKGELPRLEIQNSLRRMKMARELGYQGFWFEAGQNINATIGLQLLNQMWLDPSLTWEEVSERFLRACFAGSYAPMKELFTRWWHTWMPEEEIPMAINNLAQATLLAKSKDEFERINDLKAYVHYIVLYQEWNQDHTNAKKVNILFDYVYSSANKLIVHVPAIYSLFSSYLSEKDRDKYNVYVRNDWAWIKPLTNDLITKNFTYDQKHYGSKPNSFSYLSIDKVIPEDIKVRTKKQTFTFSAKFSEKINFYGSGPITVTLINPVDLGNKEDNKLQLSVLGEAGKYLRQEYVQYNKPSTTIKLPVAGYYTISFLQFFYTDIQISGRVVPILLPEQIETLKPRSFSGSRNSVPITKPSKKMSYYYLAP